MSCRDKETNDKRPPEQMEGFLHDALGDNDSLLSTLIHSLPINVYAKNTEGKFIFANSCYCKSTGKKLEHILGTDDYGVHPQALADKYRGDDERIMASGKTETIEEEWQSLDGEKGYIQVMKSPLFDLKDKTKVRGTIGVFWDITSKKRVEAHLAEERNLLRTLIDNLPNYIYVKDRDCRFLLGNKAVADIMGAPGAQALPGKSDFDYYPRELAEKFYRDDLAVVDEEIEIIDKEEMILGPDGAQGWSSTSKFPLKNLTGETIGLVGIGKDITAWKKDQEELKQLEVQLHHSQRMETVGTLAAGIAHDFNNLLNVINGYTELLLLDTVKEENRQEILTKINQAGQSAATLVRQLTAFSAKQVIQPRAINLNDAVSDILLMLQRVIGEKIKIELNLETPLWNVHIDPVQVEQITVNLAANARDAMPDGGCIGITTCNIKQDDLPLFQQDDMHDSGDYIKLSISDTGCGIAPEMQERVFDPFFTTKEKHKGTGLGLATVFGIVKQNNGLIQLESELGVGTSFHIYFPISDDPIEEIDASADQLHLPPEARTILVVEDNDDVRDLVLEILSKLGCEVTGKRSGAEALDHLRSAGTGPDLLLTDVVMPGMNGKELANAVTAENPDTRVLFMSGHTDEAINEYDLAHPGRDFIHKPFSADKLVSKIQNLFSC